MGELVGRRWQMGLQEDEADDHPLLQLRPHFPPETTVWKSR